LEDLIRAEKEKLSEEEKADVEQQAAAAKEQIIEETESTLGEAKTEEFQVR